MVHCTLADEGHSHKKHEITQTNTRFTPQSQESLHSYTNNATITRSRHNYMNHATITRFTPQSQESRHKETADQSWAQNSLNSQFSAFFHEHMATCSSCQAALLTSYTFCPLCGQSKEGDDSVGRSKFTPAPTTNRSSSKTLGYKQFKGLKEEKRATYFRRDSREKKNRNATAILQSYCERWFHEIPRRRYERSER